MHADGLRSNMFIDGQKTMPSKSFYFQSNNDQKHATIVTKKRFLFHG